MKRKPTRRDLLIVRDLPCLVLRVMWAKGVPLGDAEGVIFCRGDVEAHHMGERGLGQKASDLTCIPFCQRHHRDWHDCTGIFKGWSKDERAEFATRCNRRDVVSHTHAA